MTDYKLEQFEAEITAALASMTKRVGHNDRLGLYGGMCKIPEPYRSKARDLAIEHAKYGSKNGVPLSDSDAANRVDVELGEQKHCSVQSLIGQVVKHGGNVPDDVKQRLAELSDGFAPAKVRKPRLEELVQIELDKAEELLDLRCMGGKDTGEELSRQGKLRIMYDEAKRMDVDPGPLKRKHEGGELPRHAYIKIKKLSSASNALEASSAFVDPFTQDLIVPFLAASRLENRWRDSSGNPVHLSDDELAIRNCDSYQRINTESKKFCSGTKTRSLFHPIGDIRDASLILMVEGFATGLAVYQETGIPTVCVGSCNNFLAAAASIINSEVCGYILIIGDAGTEDKLKKTQKAIEAYSWLPGVCGWGYRVKWATTPGPENYDLCDMRIDKGSEAVKTFVEDLVERFHELNQSDHKKAFIRSAQEILSDDTLVVSLVDELVPEGSIGVLVGETGAGKSFFALDMSCCVWTGTPFHGRKTKRTGVLYIAAEGNRGYRRRLKAWLRKHGMDDMPEGLYLTSGAVDLLDEDKLREIQEFCEANEVGLVVFDTLHRCFSGEENSARDMGAALQNLGKFFSEPGITVALVHHCGLSAGGRGRGSSALKAGVDWELLIEKYEGGLKITPTKIKDGELFPAESFKLVSQSTGWVDEKGPIESLVLERGEVHKRLLSLKKDEAKLWDALKGLGTSFTREKAEVVTFPLVSQRNKGRALTRFLDKLTASDWLEFSEDMYMIIK